MKILINNKEFPIASANLNIDFNNSLSKRLFCIIKGDLITMQELELLKDYVGKITIVINEKEFEYENYKINSIRQNFSEMGSNISVDFIYVKKES